MARVLDLSNVRMKLADPIEGKGYDGRQLDPLRATSTSANDMASCAARGTTHAVSAEGKAPEIAFEMERRN